MVIVAEGAKETKDDVGRGEEKKKGEPSKRKKGARQATKAIRSYSRPSGGAVPVAGRPFTLFQVKES